MSPAGPKKDGCPPLAPRWPPRWPKTLDQVRQLRSEQWEWAIDVADAVPIDPRKLAMKKVTELRVKLKSGEDRAAVEPLLRTALADYFFADMRHRLRELDEIKDQGGLQRRNITVLITLAC